MAERGEADITVGRPAAAIELPGGFVEVDYCEFLYIWDSAMSARRRQEFARERPRTRYVDIRIVIDGVPVDLTADDLLALRRRKKGS